jgi:putative phosphoribosyl transferase
VPFVDRDQAGRQLGERLGGMALVHPVVLALPRGGVPVGYQVAAALGAPLDVIVVRKLGTPFQRELAMGAIGEGSVRVLDDDVLRACGLTEEEVDAAEARERKELERRARQYRQGAPRIGLSGRTTVVVDDGMATGSTARAACSVARAQGAGYVVMAVPVASGHAVDQLEGVSDAVVVLEQPEPFYAVGQWYHRFDQTSDAHVVALLAQARGRASHRTPDPPPSEEERGRGPNAL